MTRHGLIAVALAALALFVQALIPAAAIAHDNAADAAGGGLTMTICTGQGMKTVDLATGKVVSSRPDPAARHFMGLHCTACAAANFAAVKDHADIFMGAPVRYGAQAIAFQPERTHAATQARAPPRPPGQGPPSPSIV